jgi:hypothetical protein
LIARAKAVRASAGLADGEIGRRPLRRWLPFLPRQRGADQRTVDRPFFDLADLRVIVMLVLIDGPFAGLPGGSRPILLGFLGRHELVERPRRFDGFVRGVVYDALGLAGGHLGRQSGGIRFLALPRDLRVLVVMVGVAGRAARLLHIIANQGHDDVIRHPPLARTVVVQNVTKPKLALLHSKTPEGTSRGGEKDSRKAAQS